MSKSDIYSKFLHFCRVYYVIVRGLTKIQFLVDFKSVCLARFVIIFGGKLGYSKIFRCLEVILNSIHVAGLDCYSQCAEIISFINCISSCIKLTLCNMVNILVVVGQKQIWYY